MLLHELLNFRLITHRLIKDAIKNVKIQIKDKLSHHFLQSYGKTAKAFFFASLPGSLTVEAALVVPIFVFVTVAVFQYGIALEEGVKLGTALGECSEKLAVAAYIEKDIGDRLQVPELAEAVLSIAYAQREVTHAAGDLSAITNVMMLQSSFLKKDHCVDLVLNYQIRCPTTVISLPWMVYIQRARVRAWVGRTPEKAESEQKETEEEQTVFVTATGSVYHRSSDCSYLRLSTHAVRYSELVNKRNNSGGKYYACSLCKTGTPGNTVYITNDGTKYHSTKSCSGLKRTVSEIKLSQIGERHACSKCG